MGWGGDGNSLKSTPGWRSSPPARLRGRHGRREAQSRVACGVIVVVVRLDAAGSRLLRSCERGRADHRPRGIAAPESIPLCPKL